VLLQAAHREGVRGSGGVAPSILNLGSMWSLDALGGGPLRTQWIGGWVATEWAWTLYPLPEAEPRYLLCPDRNNLTEVVGGISQSVNPAYGAYLSRELYSHLRLLADARQLRNRQKCLR
jgi:hypothetical protein